MSDPRQPVVLIGGTYPSAPKFSLEEAIARHERVRDRIAIAIHEGVEVDTTPWNIVANCSFTYSFKTFKALGLLLKDRHYESGSTLLRQLWESLLNLHWVEQDPEVRSQDFCNFTSMELRKQFAKSMDNDREVSSETRAERLGELDRAAAKIQGKFFTTKKGGKRKKPSPHFSMLNAQERASQLGNPWDKDYSRLYELCSHYVHASPGAILRTIFFSDSQQREASEVDASSIVAHRSIEFILRGVEVMTRIGLIACSSEIEDAARRSAT